METVAPLLVPYLSVKECVTLALVSKNLNLNMNLYATTRYNTNPDPIVVDLRQYYNLTNLGVHRCLHPDMSRLKFDDTVRYITLTPQGLVKKHFSNFLPPHLSKLTLWASMEQRLYCNQTILPSKHKVAYMVCDTSYVCSTRTLKKPIVFIHNNHIKGAISQRPIYLIKMPVELDTNIADAIIQRLPNSAYIMQHTSTKQIIYTRNIQLIHCSKVGIVTPITSTGMKRKLDEWEETSVKKAKQVIRTAKKGTKRDRNRIDTFLNKNLQ